MDNIKSWYKMGAKSGVIIEGVKMTTDYKARLKSAEVAWLQADPENRQQVNETWQAYKIALENYQNVRGV